MSDETDFPTETTTGLGRRDFVKRGAIVGGMVWAAPLIQSIGSPAFAFTVGEEGLCGMFFNFKLEGIGDSGGPSLVSCPGVDANQTGEGNACLPDDWGVEPAHCLTSGQWADATKTLTIPLSHGGVSKGNAVLTFGSDYKSATLTVPDGCKVLSGDAKAGEVVEDPENPGVFLEGCYEFTGSETTLSVASEERAPQNANGSPRPPAALSNIAVAICCNAF